MIRHERLVDLTEEEFARCRQLTFGERGLMEEEAVYRRSWEKLIRPYRYTHVVLLYKDDKIIGWSLLQPVRRQARYLAYFYVDPLHRGCGYGTVLFNAAKTIGRYKIAVKPDWSNREFFERFKNEWTYSREDAKV